MKEKVAVRDEYIDWLKGFAIICVVWGHCWLRSNYTFWLIYRFHMPLFLIVSGYLVTNRYDYKTFVKLKFKQIMIPYFIFMCLSYLISVVALNSKPAFNVFIRALFKGGKFCSLVNNIALWYLPAYFIALLVFYWIIKIRNNAVLAGIVISLSIIAKPFNIYLQGQYEKGYIPLYINVLPAALACLTLGYLCKKFSYKGELVKDVRLNTMISMGLGVLGIVLSINNRNQIITISTYTYLFAAFCIIQFIVFVTKDNRNKVIQYVGKKSLIILGLHRPLLFLFQQRGVEEIFLKNNLQGDVGALILTIICIVIILSVDYVYRLIKDICFGIWMKQLVVVK